MVKTVLWDNDGVLVDTEGLYFQACREALASVGFGLTRAQFIEQSLKKGKSVFDLLSEQDPGVIDRLRVGDRVTLWGAVPQDAVAAVFHDASIAVNNAPPGLFDKAVLEGMMCGVPSVVANAAFDHLMGDHVDLLRFDDGEDAAALAERLSRLLAMSEEERQAIGRELAARAAESHSLDGLMDKLVAVMAT